MLHVARLSSQPESVIVRTKFCHAHIIRYHRLQRKAGRQDGVSEWRSRGAELLNQRSSPTKSSPICDSPPSGGGEIALKLRGC
jgi:hypothetical protein